MTLVATEGSIVVLADRTASAATVEELARSSRYRLLGRVDSVRGAVDAVRLHRADILVVEVSTPDRLRELAGGLTAAVTGKVVVVSALPPEAALLTVLAAGARGFLRRPVEPGMLERAITAVTAGHTFVDPSSTTWLVGLALHGHRSRPHDGLTLRQLQVVELVRGGLTNREIARVLDLSLATVKSHLHEAMRRLGAGDRWAATAMVEQLRQDRT